MLLHSDKLSRLQANEFLLLLIYTAGSNCISNVQNNVDFEFRSQNHYVVMMIFELMHAYFRLAIDPCVRYIMRVLRWYLTYVLF